ncbi:hypothetical protein K504DRAFT_466109 [Pleomassaria siparia CBS 279.74]|uniref:WD40 repeat-like protein n=1 Tax=Pleomassaria siparia CBS 279.74 TaxID=1314801 RepID=A0A6G1KE87_9PLEO|nr:hypothetical protein K504DRAFT_466109 [Pleomassaria siparia CBS 279.74]
MAQPELPGYYFDPVKKKYFKIQRTQDAPRQDSRYSQANISRQKKNDEDKEIASKSLETRRKQTILRSTRNPLLQASLARETGLKQCHVRWPGAITSGYRSTIVADEPIRYFDRDPITNTLYIAKGEASVQRQRPDQPWDILAHLTSPISSLDYLPASGALCVTTSGSDRSPVIYLTDPDRDGPYLGEMFTPRHCNTIWGTAARPASSSSLCSGNSNPATATEHIAVGASSSLVLLTRANGGIWETDTDKPRALDSDVLALEWLSDTTLSFGCRSGFVYLYDLRTKQKHRILKHPYPVSQLRRTDHETRIVCSGLQNSCVLYDMRMARAQYTARDRELISNSDPYSHTGYPSRKRQRRAHPIAVSTSTQPVLEFQHDNADDLELGLDVHARLGLVAAAQSDARIRISNLWTGKVVREYDMREANAKAVNGQKSAKTSVTNSNRVRCLRFVDDGGDGGASLWASWEGGIQRIGW